VFQNSAGWAAANPQNEETALVLAYSCHLCP